MASYRDLSKQKLIIASKCVIFTIVLLFWVAGALLTYVGSVIWHASGSRFDIAQDSYSLVPAVLSITVGIFLVVLGVLGFIAVIKEKLCILSFFYSFLLIIFLGQIASAILAIVYHRQLDTIIRQELQREISLYDTANHAALSAQLDLTQQWFSCCGIDNYTDWFGSPWSKMQNHSALVPDSCCHNDICKSDQNATESYFVKGCLNQVEEFFGIRFGLICAVGFSVAFIQALGLVALTILLCCRRQEIPYNILGINDALRV